MEDQKAIECLSAIAHGTRLKVFRLLVSKGDDGLSSGEIARVLDTPATTMSTHLGILARAGVIRARRQSRVVCYAVSQDGVRSLLNYLISDCCGGRPDLCAPSTAALSPSSVRQT
jgi:DNA-binding transcriptional ArsR family regulator